eukprot:365480-Chlamydomonas_euryale.AAC.9
MDARRRAALQPVRACMPIRLLVFVIDRCAFLRVVVSSRERVPKPKSCEWRSALTRAALYSAQPWELLGPVPNAHWGHDRVMTEELGRLAPSA